MAAHVDQRAATAQRRVLAEARGQGRIPAGKLGPSIGRLSEPALLDQFGRSPVLGMEAHHESCSKSRACLAAPSRHFFGFGYRTAQRFLAKNMFAGFGAGQHLGMVRLDRAGDVHRINFRRQQRVQAVRRQRAELFCHFLVRDCVGAIHRHELGIPRGNETFRNGPAAGDSARTDYAPFHFAFHLRSF